MRINEALGIAKGNRPVYVPQRPPGLSQPLPSPTGGWNDRDALSSMPITDAVIMDNFFPSTSSIDFRRGHASHATGLGATVESLISYNGLSANSLFGAAGTNVYDVTSAGAVGAAVLSGKTNARWQYVQMSTAGGDFLFICNGDDTPQTYDGSTWAASGITGPTIANLIWCNVFQRRLFVGEKNSLKFWYGAAAAIGGAFSSFNLGEIATKGGYIMGMGTWSRGAAGIDDLAVFVTSEGQAIIYQGSDPSSGTWFLLGQFDIGKPIGRRFFVKTSSDLILVTQDGVTPLSTTLPVDRAQAQRVTLSAKINNAFNQSARDTGSTFGWQPFLYPRGAALFINVPTTVSGTLQQYVFNTITNAACRYTGMNAYCWGLLNDDPYFGAASGVVHKADTGTADNTANIQFDVMQAFSYFERPGLAKNYKLVELIFQASGALNVALDLNVDFNIMAPTTVSTSTGSATSLWDVALWDQGLWGGDSTIFKTWRSVAGYGHSAACRIRINTSTISASLMATDAIYEPGGYL